LGDKLSLAAGIKFPTGEIAVDTVNTALQIKAGATPTKVITVTATGGTLHGTWFSENSVSASDRRLKTNIVPLKKALLEFTSREGSTAASVSSPGDSRQRTDSEGNQVVSWVLRELRPVSFHFRGGTDAKMGRRFGFIAQELQQILPNVVRGSGAEYRSVLYQDFIALLTLAAKQQQGEIEEQNIRLHDQDAKLKSQADNLEKLKSQAEKHSKEMDLLKQYIHKMNERFDQVLRKMLDLEAALSLKRDDAAERI
jgi:hypothetical protein